MWAESANQGPRHWLHPVTQTDSGVITVIPRNMNHTIQYENKWYGSNIISLLPGMKNERMVGERSVRQKKTLLSSTESRSNAFTLQPITIISFTPPAN
jgi:hypothetical protein